MDVSISRYNCLLIVLGFVISRTVLYCHALYKKFYFLRAFFSRKIARAGPDLAAPLIMTHNINVDSEFKYAMHFVLSITLCKLRFNSIVKSKVQSVSDSTETDQKIYADSQYNFCLVCCDCTSRFIFSLD